MITPINTTLNKHGQHSLKYRHQFIAADVK